MIFRHDEPSEHLGNVSLPGSGFDVPAPVTVERIGAQLREHGYKFTQDDDGDLTGVWDENQFWFILGGSANEVLQIRARWKETIPSDKHLDALLIVNDWNRDHLWPKAYFREEGDIVVYAEVSIDLEYGVTDAQLQDILACGLITAVQFFSEIEVPMD